ncbi:MAG: ankyrin repeat domain-containing protein [Patescibacteria group bacterium]|nr:ankyrin repeat domain-containing protein [Patescibacteria group bacterium]
MAKDERMHVRRAVPLNLFESFILGAYSPMNRRLTLITLKYILSPEAVAILAPNAATFLALRKRMGPHTGRGRRKTTRVFACSAAETNNTWYLAKLSYLCSVGNWGRFPWELVRDKAVAEGHIPVIRWLWSHGHQLKELCRAAAEKGSLRVLRWASNRGHELGEAEYATATANGQLAVIKWLRAMGCPGDEEVCAEAAWHGRLEVLKWARANGCSWDDQVALEAARRGHLDVLEWARANGCPWNPRICRAAWLGNQLDVLDWLKWNGCTCRGRYH